MPDQPLLFIAACLAAALAGSAVAVLVARNRRLERRAEMLEAVLGSMSQGVIAFDRDLGLVAWNRSLGTVRGYPDEMLTPGRPFADFMRHDVGRNEFGPGDPEEQVKRQLERARAFAPHAFERERPDGRVIEVRGGPLPGGGFVSTYADVTQRRAAETARAEFLATMSHELRTPLNAVIGYSEMLMDMGGDDPEMPLAEAAPDLERIRVAGRHLMLLIDDVLEWSTIEAGKAEVLPETFELRGLIEDVGTLVTPLAAKRNNAFSLAVDPAVGTMHSDPTKVRQILFSLLGNAAKFTEEGDVSLDVRLDGERVRIVVSDTGIGMDDTETARLFEPFTQADGSLTRPHGGTGLGLTITRHFCRMLEGSIEVASEKGRGTTFTVVLPLRSERRQKERNAP